MKRFKNILLFAGSEGWKDAALEQALTLVKRNKAKLKIVDVIEDLPREIRVRITVKSALETQELVINKRKNTLEQLIKPMRKDGVYVCAKVLIGTPFLEIIREVLRDKHDLVIKTARGKGGLKEILFGSTAMHLMRKCPCPVWVIKPTHHKKYARIMAAVDPDPSDEAKNALNTKIMELATSLASLEGSEFHVVHAWKIYSETMLLGRGGLSKREVDRCGREARKMHKGWLNELIEQYNPETPKDRIHLQKGDAGKLIPALVKRKRIELIVMGTVSRIGIAGLLIGNTAEKVLREVDCSVLIVKPYGFVSPVRLGEK